MNFKYTTAIVMLLMIFALSRGFVAHYDFISFGALIAHADDGDGGDSGGSGDSGDSGGSGDSGDSGGSGDSGDSGGQGDSGDSGGTGDGTGADTGDTGDGDSGEPPACIPVEVPQTPVACSQYAGTLSGTDYGIPADHIVDMATWTLNSCTNAVTYTGGCSAPPPPLPPAPVNNAVCVINTVPISVTPGQSFFAQVDVTNSGNTIWTTASGYKLGSQHPQDNTIWGTSRVALPIDPFPAGGTFSFSGFSTAPTTPDVYTFAWRMVQEGVEWFGSTCSANIVVTGPSTPPPTPIPGCTDATATNYNPLATVNDGSCTYPPPPPPSSPVCILSASPTAIQLGSSSTLSWTTSNATTFSIDNGIGSVTPVAAGSNSVTPPLGGTTYTGTATGAGGSVTCTATITVTTTPPPPSAPVCTLIASPTTISSGSSSTLSWTTSNATTFSIDNGIGSVTPVNVGTNSVSPTVTTTYTGTATGAGGTISCSATVTVTTGGGGCTSNCGGGGGGGGSPQPNVTLATLSHVSSQPLAFLYLSQIPYTGLELGLFGTALYWIALIIFALVLAYFVLFSAVPIANRSLRSFGSRVLRTLNAQEPAYVRSQSAPSPIPVMQETKEAPRGYSSYEGFKSFARNGAISIDDIVKGLARVPAVALVKERNVEPVYEKVEPIYENVEPIINETTVEKTTVSAPTHVRGFISALVEGDRVAVFAGLRQHVRGSGAPEKLMSEIVCLLDDAYRARIDGTDCDSDVVRLTARLNTPILEKLIASLTTAIDSSYSQGATGAKLALTRALAVLGA